MHGGRSESILTTIDCGCGSRSLSLVSDCGGGESSVILILFRMLLSNRRVTRSLFASQSCCCWIMTCFLSPWRIRIPGPWRCFLCARYPPIQLHLWYFQESFHASPESSKL